MLILLNSEYVYILKFLYMLILMRKSVALTKERHVCNRYILNKEGHSLDIYMMIFQNNFKTSSFLASFPLSNLVFVTYKTRNLIVTCQA